MSACGKSLSHSERDFPLLLREKGLGDEGQQSLVALHSSETPISYPLPGSRDLLPFSRGRRGWGMRDFLFIKPIFIKNKHKKFIKSDFRLSYRIETNRSPINPDKA